MLAVLAGYTYTPWSVVSVYVPLTDGADLADAGYKQMDEHKVWTQ